jgi:hypothetical protein
MVRDQIQDLISQLEAGFQSPAGVDAVSLETAFTTASVLLERAYLESLPASHPPGPGWTSDLDARFRGLLPNHNQGIVLTTPERERLIGLLLRLLEGAPEVAARAASSFIRTDAREAVPLLTTLIRDISASQPLLAERAIVAVESILGRTVDIKTPRSSESQALLTDASAALRYAAGITNGHSRTLVAAVAKRALASIANTFGRSF